MCNFWNFGQWPSWVSSRSSRPMSLLFRITLPQTKGFIYFMLTHFCQAANAHMLSHFCQTENHNQLMSYCRFWPAGSSRTAVRLSPGHFRHVETVGNLVTAQDVRPMDSVFVVCPDLSMRKQRVVSVERVVGRGLYCPHTTGGSLVVDGVLVSCYTNLLPPTIAHQALAPVRFLYHTLPDPYFRFLLPYDQDSGMPKLLMYLRWILCQGKGIKSGLRLCVGTLWKLGSIEQMELPPVLL